MWLDQSAEFSQMGVIALAREQQAPEFFLHFSNGCGKGRLTDSRDVSSRFVKFKLFCYGGVRIADLR